ncbi:hypothetical protein LRD69_02660 [Streptomyces sp. JH14]|uniref:hypothetical protein n=1 Tax=Streptomyces sp. JH14 TaxID=2793630 RepID=UPI0023F9413F|nr:hypothetical protein [Streptomyces sp. JH14]MDF6041077.1 hypothetical protein [Streptomyces sp. JH14]
MNVRFTARVSRARLDARRRQILDGAARCGDAAPEMLEDGLRGLMSTDLQRIG